MNEETSAPKHSASQIRLSTLLLLMTLFAVVAGWAVDRWKLAAQIEPPVPRSLFTFKLKNASAKLVAAKLNELYDGTVVGEKTFPFVFLCGDDRSFVANASDLEVWQVRALLQHFDRVGTEYAQVTTATNMHSDAFIESLVDHGIVATNGEIDPDNLILSVVPAGESHPRFEVFRKLNLDESKIRNFRERRLNMVDFLTWQVSPSYDITCMSGNRNLDNRELEMDDPKRKVYGIRLSRTSN